MRSPFSSRLPGQLGPNRLSLAQRRLRQQGMSFVDLTASNPAVAGFEYPSRLHGALGAVDAAAYRPEPLGLESARAAVADYLGSYQLPVQAGRVVLTASTSDAYATLFKLLCDPGDEVAVPRPSYPLLEYLTRLESVIDRPYALEFHGRWMVDLGEFERVLTPRTRAVVMVNPNNPTGSFVSGEDLQRVVSLCHDRGLALIVDEVFGFYPMQRRRRGPSVLDHTSDVLTFVLGGLSKAMGLPGLKLGWIVVAGPEAAVDGALQRLELIADTYLSVGMPVQLAARDLLRDGAAMTAQISARVRDNHGQLRRIISGHPAARLLPAEGGWYAVVRVPATAPEESMVLDLLEHEHVLVHPGYFFDFPNEAFVVMSLLPEPSVFDPAARRVLARVTRDGLSRP